MEKNNNWKAWLYLAPALILMGIFTFFPLINTFIVSFLKDYNSATGANSGFTFENYGRVLGITPVDAELGIYDNNFLSFTGPSALTNTLLITFVTVPISVIIALAISILLNNIKVCRKFLQTVFFMPYVTNIIAVGMVFSVMFSSTGIINRIFGVDGTNWIGVGASWGKSMFVLCIYVIWNALPYKILIFSSGLQGIDKQYYEAAKIDSTPRFKVATKITIPLLSPQILYITITSFISAFKEYNAIIGLFNRNYTTSGNVPDLYTVVYYIYDMLNSGTSMVQFACAGAVVLFVIIMLFTLIQMQISKRKVVY